ADQPSRPGRDGGRRAANLGCPRGPGGLRVAQRRLPDEQQLRAARGAAPGARGFLPRTGHRGGVLPAAPVTNGAGVCDLAHPTPGLIRTIPPVLSTARRKMDLNRYLRCYFDLVTI